MKFSISNIGWPESLDEDVISIVRSLGYEGLEIAPTRCFMDGYDVARDELIKFKDRNLRQGLNLCSMQSLLFGITTPIFSSEENKNSVLSKMDKVFNFAQQLEIPNLVFGSPSIRNVNNEDELNRSIEFFKACAHQAHLKKCTLSIEPNPTIYKTNFLTTTADALDYIKNLEVKGIGLNFDLGTVIHNQESIENLLTLETIAYVHHVHISEPLLAPIQDSHRELHKELLLKLKTLKYTNYVSIEMKSIDDIKEIERILRYIKDVAIEVGVWNG